MSAILLLLLLATSDVSPEANQARLERSIREGTGGDDARWVLCNLGAVKAFYDGKQTPSEIPADMLWSNLGYELKAALPAELSTEGRTLVVEELRALRARHERFRSEGMAIARRIAETSGEEEARLRRDARELSNSFQQAVDEAARRSLRKLSEDLSDADRAVFTEWLEARRDEVMIVRFDWTKVDYECLDRQR